jgi:dTDP-4-dehydrorhamnose 3,5-epimerase-like enzyme
LKSPKLFDLENFSDYRGTISFCNQLEGYLFKRFYMLFSDQEKQVRAWQGHLKEEKFFLPISGKFKIVLVPIIDLPNQNFGNPKMYNLDSSHPQVLYVPGGYLNGFQFQDKGGQLMVFSNFNLEESKNDEVRFEKSTFYVW